MKYLLSILVLGFSLSGYSNDSRSNSIIEREIAKAEQRVEEFRSFRLAVDGEVNEYDVKIYR